MNWAAVGAIAAIATFFVTVGGGIFLYGKLTQKVDDTKACTEDHERRLNGHDSRLGDQAVAIGKLEAWRDGYNSAVGSSAAREGR